MNIDNMTADLRRIQGKWKADAKSLDVIFNEGPRWIDGVVYGIALAFEIVKAHIAVDKGGPGTNQHKRK